MAADRKHNEYKTVLKDTALCRESYKMNTFVDIISQISYKSETGIPIISDEVVASVMAYRESQKKCGEWKKQEMNTTDMFRLRKISGVRISSQMVIVCLDGRFEIVLVEGTKIDDKYDDKYIDVYTRKVLD